MAEVRLLGERVEVTLPVLLLEFPFLPHVIPPTVLKNPLMKTPTESRVDGGQDAGGSGAASPR